MKVFLKIFGSLYLKQGVEYLKIDDVKFSLKYSKIRVRFDNLFNGNKQLENVANDVINQNIQLIEGNVIPQIEKEMTKRILATTNQVFEKAPANEFFPWKMTNKNFIDVEIIFLKVFIKNKKKI